MPNGSSVAGHSSASFPDQSNIDRIRDALWSRSGSGASVMVGSGFSRNSHSSRPNAGMFPTWEEVAGRFRDRLYPQCGDTQHPRASAETNMAVGYLELAQEYRAAFGRSDLHGFLQDLIRDREFVPSGMHARLLRLPWRDVYTTNWDTLLERTRELVYDRSYSIIRNMAEIPLAPRPRIVKLHGSLPAHFPLIVTAEDYRKYPTKSAPFVNMAQQAMMETVFCLIGFSGSDPNFLHWSGWVRDNLGSAAPKIYLAGWLALSTHSRRMLEDRNVVPIDLARHPRAGDWPVRRQHEYATEWILRSLEGGQPYDLTEWPEPPRGKRVKAPQLLSPVHQLSSATPLRESSLGGQNTDQKLVDRVSNTLKTWRHNRLLYPGWVVMPSGFRSAMVSRTRAWQKTILGVLPELPPLARLAALGELFWRLEVLVEPVESELEDAADRALDLNDLLSPPIGRAFGSTMDRKEIEQHWRVIAMLLIAVARHRLDRDAFERRIALVESHFGDDVEVSNGIRHERCLWHALALDYAALKDMLAAWDTSDCNPMWAIRKAALVFESGQEREARVLVEDGLAAIRGLQRDDKSLATYSQEGWALWSTLRIEDFRLPARWDELTAVKGNARLEMLYLGNALEGKSLSRPPPFDIGARESTAIVFSGARREATAYRAVRLSEIAGLAPTANSMVVASAVLVRAAQILSRSAPELAVRLVIRAGQTSGDMAIGHVLSRTQVAMLPSTVATQAAASCERVIEYAFPMLISEGPISFPGFWAGRIEVAMEALSRLVVRLDTDGASNVFGYALRLYRNEYIAGKPALGNAIRNLMTRAWSALPHDRRRDFWATLLGTPMVGLDGFRAWSSHYPEPSDLLDFVSMANRTADNEEEWLGAVELVIRGLTAGGEARKRAAKRVATTALRRNLTGPEAQRVAAALWSSSYLGRDGLPGETEIWDGVLMVLPEPEPGLAMQRFRAKWLGDETVVGQGGVGLEDVFHAVGVATWRMLQEGNPFDFLDTEIERLIELFKQWLELPIRRAQHPLAGYEYQQSVSRALDGLAMVLGELELPSAMSSRMLTKIGELNDAGFPGCKIVVGVIRANSEELDRIGLVMRSALSSKERDVAEGAVRGLWRWLKMSMEAPTSVPAPPEDLVREIGIVISTRRGDVLAVALQLASWVFEEGDGSLQEVVRDLACQGLGYLLEELRYDRQRDQDEDVDVPGLRQWSGQLAVSMAGSGLAIEPVVARWLESVKNDPLPEVRNLRGWRETW